MWQGFAIITTNLGISFENIVLLTVALGCLIVTGINFNIGLITLMILSGSLFIWFYSQSLNFGFALITFFISLCILSLSLYFTSKKAIAGGIA